MEKVSIIIPTRNRKESLVKVLASLSEQHDFIFEVIVVDSSDLPLDNSIFNAFQFNKTVLLHTSPSVCTQRNVGIREAGGDFVFLLDDDITTDKNYILTALHFFKQNTAAIAVSGLVIEKNTNGKWEYTFPEISFFKLVWTFLFQLGIWSNLDEVKETKLNSFLLKKIKSYYKTKDNTISKAGWPMLTNFSSPHFRTQIYGLGASIIKRDWLLQHLYDEGLGNHGIGDNYGVAINLQPNQGVFVLSDIHAYHFKIAENRLAATEAYYKRVLALNYFSTQQHTDSKAWLIWSLFGNLLSELLRLNFSRCKINIKLMFIIAMNKNPLFKQA